MKNIKFISLFLISLNVFSQNNLGVLDDRSRIIISTYLPPNTDNNSTESTNLLKNKLDKIVTSNGIGGSSNSSRFIITSNIVVLNKEITPSAPPQHLLELEISFFIGDAVTGTKYSSVSKNIVGIGPSEIKAYLNAVNQIKPTDKIFVEFIKLGKDRIIEYYNSQCDFILKSAETAVSQNNFDDAIYQLTQVPEICKECYEKCMNNVIPVVQKKIDRDCSIKLLNATNLWNSNLDFNTANQVGEILNTIDPKSNCFKDVEILSKKIELRVKELDNRDWKLQLKQQQDDIDIQKASIQSARDIGVAYGNNQPKTITTYNIKGWW